MQAPGASHALLEDEIGLVCSWPGKTVPNARKTTEEYSINDEKRS
jgi:hypothetical protein